MLRGVVHTRYLCRYKAGHKQGPKTVYSVTCIPPSTRHKCTYETNFMRNNVIMDTLEKLTNTPYIFEDDTVEESLIMKNKQIASAYALMIILCILYIVISDFFDDKK